MMVGHVLVVVDNMVLSECLLMVLVEVVNLGPVVVVVVVQRKKRKKVGQVLVVDPTMVE